MAKAAEKRRGINESRPECKVDLGRFLGSFILYTTHGLGDILSLLG
jgi:hypothetical protein